MSADRMLVVFSLAMVLVVATSQSFAQTTGQTPSRWQRTWTNEPAGTADAPAAPPSRTEPHEARDRKAYVAVAGGYTMVDDAELTNLAGSSIGDNDLEFDPGVSVSASVGQYFGPLRAEGEIAYRTNDLDRLDLPAADTRVNGDLSSLWAMFNLYYDLQVVRGFDLYAGAGAGLTYTEGDISGVIDTNATGRTTFTDEDDDWAFAYQFMGGLGIGVCRGMTLTTEYRIAFAEGPGFDSVEIDDLVIHTVQVGLRFDL